MFYPRSYLSINFIKNEDLCTVTVARANLSTKIYSDKVDNNAVSSSSLMYSLGSTKWLHVYLGICCTSHLNNIQCRHIILDKVWGKANIRITVTVQGEGKG